MATPTRAGQVKVAPAEGSVVDDTQRPDLQNRDPNGLNKHIVVDFYSVLAEPEGSRSIDFVWDVSEVCYSCFFGLLYKLSSLCCGVCIAAKWACVIAPSICYNVWFCTPCYVVFKHVFGLWCWGFWFSFINCCCRPCFVACGQIFHLCGDGRKYETESPLLLPRSQGPRKKPMEEPIVEQKRDPEPEMVVKSPTPDNPMFDYDKAKVAQSIRRQMLL